MKAEPELTDDEQLRALAALSAVLDKDDGALAVLARRDSGGEPRERALPDLLAAYGHYAMRRILLASYGIDADVDPGEVSEQLAVMNRDPLVRIVDVLVDNLSRQARLAGDDPTTAELIGVAILQSFASFTDLDHTGAGRENQLTLDTREDAQAFLQALRDEVLSRS